MTVMDWRIIPRRGAAGHVVPRVEKAITSVQAVLEELRGRRWDKDLQDLLCRRALRAEALLRMVWADQGGIYQTRSLDRFAKMLAEVCTLLDENDVRSLEPNDPIRLARAELSRRLERLRRIAKESAVPS